MHFICQNTCVWLVAGVNFPPWKNNFKGKPNVCLNLANFTYVCACFVSVSSPIYSEPLTPPSNPSLSPGNSPMREGPFEKPTLPAPAEWSEFLRASNSKVERELAQLTLSDPEQRELYEAARLVQTAFRKYKVQASGSGATRLC